jgi:site-specific recombinase XerD
MLKKFSDWLKYNRSCSDYTIRNYTLGLRLFNEYLKSLSLSIEECESIKIRHIDQFIYEQRFFRKKNERTVNNYLA